MICVNKHVSGQLRALRQALVIGAATTVLLSAMPCRAQLARDGANVPGKQESSVLKSEKTAPWPAIQRPRQGAPNVLLIMTDDVGFAATSTFGGPIPTPTFDALARTGLRFNGFNTTALCSPTRASLLTGREPHNVGMGNVTNLPTAYPGYTSVIPKSSATVARVLRDYGYGTAMFGKGHITPEWEMSEAGPFDRWPTGLGFQYFYGFLSADVSQFDPFLTENTRMVPPPAQQGYHLDRDLADHAIQWVKRQHEIAPDKPFFMYYAPGAAHAPNHAPAEWLEQFKGKFDLGWDELRERIFANQKALGIIPADAKLTPRPSEFPAWSSLSADQRRLYARLMEANAASLAHADYQIGRVVDYLKASGQLDNTVVIYIQGDNGASPDGGPNGMIFEQTFINGFKETLPEMLGSIGKIGGPDAYNVYPMPWAWALDTPFQWTKGVASHFGGIRNGMVISWPRGIDDAGGLRQQFHHVADIAPTIYDIVGITPPATVDGVAQQEIDGISMAYTFAHSNAEGQRHTQVFEMMQNLGIYHDGWWAGTRPFRLGAGDLIGKPGINDRTWELYNVAEDFSQATDLAVTQPQKLADMKRLFWSEAQRNHILPIHGMTDGAEGRPEVNAGRCIFDYTAGATRIVEGAAPHTIGRSFAINADVDLLDGKSAGVLATQGGRFGGFALYFQQGVPVFHYNAVGPRQYRVSGHQAVGPGKHRVTAKFAIDQAKPGAPGTITLSIDGSQVGQGRIEHTLSGWVSHTEGFDVGEDTVTPVNSDYTITDSKFSGRLIDLRFTACPEK